MLAICCGEQGAGSDCHIATACKLLGGASNSKLSPVTCNTLPVCIPSFMLQLSPHEVIFPQGMEPAAFELFYLFAFAACREPHKKHLSVCPSLILKLPQVCILSFEILFIV